MFAAFTGEVDTIKIDLEQSRIFAPNSPGSAEDTLSSIENVQILNTSINFNLVGDNNKNILLASAGNDTLLVVMERMRFMVEKATIYFMPRMERMTIIVAISILAA